MKQIKNKNIIIKIFSIVNLTVQICFSLLHLKITKTIKHDNIDTYAMDFNQVDNYYG